MKDISQNKNAYHIEETAGFSGQLSLFDQQRKRCQAGLTFEKLTELLKSDLNFHNQSSSYFSHNFHSFPAKFPPQLPKLFIEELTCTNDIVLDPMVGSGTTIVEACFANRKGIGCDIDPLAIKISKVKTTYLNKRDLIKYGSEIYNNAKFDYENNKARLREILEGYFDPKTKEFIDYWFYPETQLELISILNQIKQIDKEDIKNFFEVIFSSIIITKSGGVSLALDLGHTRPHRIKALLDSEGNVIFGDTNFNVSRTHLLTKNIRSSLEEFWKKLNQNINSIMPPYKGPKANILYCDSQRLCLADETVDLIVTSPPYASNAIDYMRAHKFSLVWFGYKIDELTKKRNEYIGSEAISNYYFEDLPEFTTQKIDEVSSRDPKKGKVLKRYYSEMKKALTEMYRVLKSQKVAVVVVGSSIMKGVDTKTHECLKEIGNSIGFQVPHIGVRKLDRNKRMLPASRAINSDSQIQQRMHEEYVIGFYKP